MIRTDPIEGLEQKKEIQQWEKSGGTGFKTVPVLSINHHGLVFTFVNDSQNDINLKDFDSMVKKIGRRISTNAK